jgi:hypothetical protein
MTDQVRVHLLARATSAKKDDIDIGVAGELRDLRAHVVLRSWIATGETVEVGVGENSVDRPGLKKILALAESEAPPFDILLVVSADRIARGIGTLSAVERRLQKKGIAIHTLEGRWSPPLFGTTLGALDERHRSRLSKTVADLAMDHQDRNNAETSNGHVKAPSGISPLRAIARSLETLARAPGASLMDWAIANAGQSGSIAPEILAFATGSAANCAGGHSCARLYLALQGMAIPVTETTTGMDMTRREWWLRAMAEHVTGRWRGDDKGMKAIAAAQPLIWEQAQSATLGWENVSKAVR